MGSAACQPSAEAGAGPVAERARADEFAIGGPPTHYLPRLLQILDQVVKKIPGFSHEVNYFLRRETETTGTFDEPTTNSFRHQQLCRPNADGWLPDGNILYNAAPL